MNGHDYMMIGKRGAGGRVDITSMGKGDNETVTWGGHQQERSSSDCRALFMVAFAAIALTM